MKSKNEIKQIAQQIVQLEKILQIQYSNKVEEDLARITLSLELEDLIEIDNYITENNLLTK